MSDIGKSFDKLISSCILVKYRGCEIHIIKGKYYWGGTPFVTEQEAKECIDNHYIWFGRGINKVPVNRLKK